MKRIVASVGLVAVGASGLQAALLPAMTTESGKPWTVSATLRGFYDDNFNTVEDDYDFPSGDHRSTTGFEVSPSLQFSFPWEQTTLSFGYLYSLKYYQEKPINSTDYYDQSHDFHAALNHAFSERYSVSVKDSLVIGQEPDLLRAGNSYTTFERVSGDNLRNYGSIDFLAQITPELGLQLGYANTYYSYDDNIVLNPNTPNVIPSYAGLLDELDHVAHIDGRYQIAPQTIGIVGYQFRQTDYIGDQQIGFDFSRGQFVESDMKNARSHYAYVGLDHNFRPDLSGSIRVGGRFTDYYNNPEGQDATSPYAMTSLSYTYLPESYLQFGTSYDYSSTSAFSVDNSGDLTLNADAVTLFFALHHRITPKFYGTLNAQFQNNTYYGGAVDGDTTRYYLIGLNLQYRFTPNFSAEVGYNYDNADSDSQVEDIGQASYDRNRIYVGVTASY